MAELNLPAKSKTLAIAGLITSRCRDLGLNNARLVRLAGYENELKGICRLNDLLAGDLETTGALLRGLPAALNLPVHVISEPSSKRGNKSQPCSARQPNKPRPSGGPRSNHTLLS